MTILMGAKLTYQPITTPINPILRNDNLAGRLRFKAGVSPTYRVSDTLIYAWVEAVGDTESGNTNWVMLYQSTDRGQTWAAVDSKASPSLSPELAAAGWEKGEVCADTVIWDNTAKLWKMWYHGGNNAGPRQIGYATAPSTGANSPPGTWTKYAGNPILSPSGTGVAQDDVYVADVSVLRLSASSYVMFYRGSSSVDSRQRIFRATSSDGITWTKRGLCLDVGAGGAWDDEGASSPEAWQDVNGRTHLYYGGEGTTAGNLFGGGGYAYTDTDITTAGALTFTKGASNPVHVGTGAAADYNKGTGDPQHFWRDSDVLFLNTGGVNISGTLPSVNGSVRFEGRLQYWEHLPSDNPTIGGRGYRTWTGIAARMFTSLPTSIAAFNQSQFCIYGEFKCPMDNTARTFYGCQDSGASGFRRTIYARLNTTGFPEFFFRSDNSGAGSTTPGTTAAVNTITGGTRLDDNKRRWFLARKTANGAYDFYVGDETGSTLVGTSATTVALANTGNVATLVPNGAWGNFDSAVVATSDNPAMGTMGGAILVVGGTITAADALAYFNSGALARTVPTPSGGTMYRYQLGNSSGVTETELGASGVNGTHSGSPVRVEWTVQPTVDTSAAVSTSSGRRRRRSIIACL